MSGVWLSRTRLHPIMSERGDASGRSAWDDQHRQCIPANPKQCDSAFMATPVPPRANGLAHDSSFWKGSTGKRGHVVVVY